MIHYNQKYLGESANAVHISDPPTSICFKHSLLHVSILTSDYVAFRVRILHYMPPSVHCKIENSNLELKFLFQAIIGLK